MEDVPVFSRGAAYEFLWRESAAFGEKEGGLMTEVLSHNRIYRWILENSSTDILIISFSDIFSPAFYDVCFL